MNKDLIVAKTVSINASIEKVWEGLTNPEIIKTYLYGTNTITTWGIGKEIIFQGEYEGTTYKDHGVILENKLHSKISYSYWSGFSSLEDKPENYSTVSYVLNDKGTEVELTWHQQGFASEAGYNHTKDGMDAFLTSVKEAIEKN